MSKAFELRPSIAAGERLLHLDVLRGLALFGVLLVNLENFSGYEWAKEAGQPYPMGPMGGILSELTRILLEGKAAALLSLLFGAGLAIQYENAVRSGHSYWRSAMPRIAVLGLLGTAHSILLWNLDILLDYALIALLVMPFLRLSAGRVLWAIPVVMLTAGLIAAPLLAFSLEPAPAQIHALSLQHYGQGGWLDALQFRVWELLHVVGPMRLANRLVILAPFFIVGVAAWKAGVLSVPERHRRALLRLFVAFLSLGLLANLLPQEELNRWANTLSFRPLRIFIKATSFFAREALTLGYAAGILLLLQRPRWRNGLVVLAPLGRMALTQYLLQSVVCTWIFYGFGLGLYGRLPMDVVLQLGVLIFLLQVFSSRIWLARFRIGPAEWVWRRLSYGSSPRRDQGNSPTGSMGPV